MSSKIDFFVADGVATILFDNALGHNAIGLEFCQSFSSAAQACAEDRTLRVIVVKGQGEAFTVGGDLEEFLKHRDNMGEHVVRMVQEFHAGIEALHQVQIPVVCGVNGVAAGGGMSIVCVSDLAIAKRSARFNFAYTNSGLTPDGGATWFLPRLVGLQRAFDLIATNRTLSADEARDIGLISRVVEDQLFDAELEGLVDYFKHVPSNAVGRAKGLLRGSLSSTLRSQLDKESLSMVESVCMPSTVDMLDSFFQLKSK
jgi:2-(1,2-epoxy-1,2-dihydrophenyl)acetyl-CoA isomerase